MISATKTNGRSLSRCANALLIALTFKVFVAQSQNTEFSYFTTSDGLSQSWVTCIAQDTLGFLWIGTEIGLNRFDGTNFVVYKNNPTDTTSVRDNAIWSMFIDSEGRFWIGTAIGLDRYDAKRNLFIHYAAVPTSRKNAKDIRGITEDDDGNIWVATSDGIGRVNEAEKSYKIECFPSGVKPIITSFLRGKRGEFWVSVKSTGVFYFDPLRNTLRPFDLQYKVIPKPEDPEMQISCIYEDRHGELWIGTDAGLLRFGSDSKIREHYKTRAGDKNTVADDRIHYIAEDRDGNLWIAHSNGASVLDSERKNFTHHNYSPDNPQGLNNNFVTFIFRDKSDNLWFGTRNAGVNVVFATGNNFLLYRHQPNDFTSLSNNVVKAVTRDRNGVTWIGTDGGGLNRLQPDGTFRIYKHSPGKPTSLPNDLILSLYEDHDGNLWVATFGGALSVLNRDKDTFKHFFPDPNDETKLGSASVSVMHEDSQHNFWIGTWYAGIHLFDRSKQTFRRFPFKVRDGHGVSDEKILDILASSNGDVFIGTGHGLNVYHPATKTFSYFFQQENSAESLSGNVCNSICEDARGRIWIGTENGLNLYDRNANNFRRFGMAQGLPNETIQGVIAGADGNLWISTLKGLCRFNPETGEVRNYDVHDGLQGNEFITHSCFKSQDGVMLFGGNNGVNVIDPKQIKPNLFVPPVVFTQLRIMNKVVNAREYEGLSTDVAYMRELNLPYDQAFFTLEFAALNFVNAESNQYAYRFEGSDDDWHYIGNERSLTYNGLAPGEYTLRVMASNNDGLWNKTGATLKITITPPFWDTLWFRILLISFIVMLVSIGFYVRIRAVKKQKLALEDLVVKRTKQIQQQKEEIETQKENILFQMNEIAAQNERISKQNSLLQDMRRLVDDKNEKLERYNSELESTVRKRTRQLTQTNEELDQFVYRSAHDLKGPVSRIIGLCNLLYLAEPEGRFRELLCLMTGCTDEISQKLARLMNIHELNKHEIKYESIPSRCLISEVIGEVIREQNATDVQFIVEADDGNLLSDRYLLQILLKNVIDNAVKFRDPSKESCRVIVKVTKRKQKTFISVIDNGIGIPEGHESKVFDMFIVCNDLRKGFGLGLYEASLIVRRLNGKIMLNLRPGETEFRISLRAEAT